LFFYRLNELTGGERITPRGRDGTKYAYRVLESFAVWPDENGVTGRVRGRDLLTPQTCTPVPTFQKRLIVRAECV
jgi:sortase A